MFYCELNLISTRGRLNKLLLERNCTSCFIESNFSHFLQSLSIYHANKRHTPNKRHWFMSNPFIQLFSHFFIISLVCSIQDVFQWSKRVVIKRCCVRWHWLRKTFSLELHQCFRGVSNLWLKSIVKKLCACYSLLLIFFFWKFRDFFVCLSGISWYLNDTLRQSI